MSSRFISAGSIDATTGTPSSEPSQATNTPPPQQDVSNRKSKEWAEVTEQLEADRQRRIQQAKQAAEGGEKSLYEVLQANKAAKQAEFEEKSKLKNQFRALDEDEIDFLDEVKRKKKEEEEQRRQELEEGLRAFREGKMQSKGDDGGAGDDSEEGEGEWGEEEWAFTADSGRRRKRKGEGRKKLLVKKARREESNTGEGKEGDKKAIDEAGKDMAAPPPKPAAAAPVKKPSGGLLVDYGSDSDD
ncbi:putative NEFA-interacting nuclear protein NIP30 [Triangularia verruculosa]|uniref:NEFA-interacting nuclear protein NIP30 n=1 Tax=Triangularia verruculosa TaxID=2587418 RepID=A0AAN7AVB6_9PEZI|nr:putative NEFA-interacting nuclear protein NIP30 [Triangularia verruculosa]